LARGGFLELALAAAAGVDLALHRPYRAAKLGRRRRRLLRRERGKAARRRRAEGLQDSFALVFVDVHLSLGARGIGGVLHAGERRRQVLAEALIEAHLGLAFGVIAIGDFAGGDAGAELG